MTMQDWRERLQQFLTMTGRDILTHAGKISRSEALHKAQQEYTAFKTKALTCPSEAEKQFIEATEKELKALEQRRQQSDQDS